MAAILMAGVIVSAASALLGAVGMFVNANERTYRLSLTALGVGMVGVVVCVGALIVLPI